MSDQLKVEGRINHSPTNDKFEGIDTGLLEIFVSMDGNDSISATQVIGTTEEAIVGNEIGTLGYCFVRNVADENFVTIGFADVTNPDDARPLKLEPGEFAIFRANGSLYAKADTDSVRIQYYFFED